MKKLTTQIISFILTLSMLFSLSVPVFATERYNNTNLTNSVVSQEEIETARETYSSLTPEARAIFDASLAGDAEMLKFHQTYVDKNFIPPAANIRTMSARSATDPMKVLMAELGALGLSTATLYSLKAMGAGMVVSVADGPLPVGEILLAAATASAAVVLAANWKTDGPKFNQIVSAFQKAFANSVNNILRAFSSIKNDINAELEKKPSVTVSGKTVTVNGVKYICDTEADELTEKQKKNNRYFPALLYKNTVYVDASHPISTKIAEAIRDTNGTTIGVWATTESYARGLCGGTNAIWHNTHKSSEGYFYHYHHPSYSKFHCWYLS